MNNINTYNLIINFIRIIFVYFNSILVLFKFHIKRFLKIFMYNNLIKNIQ